MAGQLVRLAADVGPAAVWLGGGALGLMAVFVAYIGCLIVATLRAATAEERRYRYRMFRDLVELVQVLCSGRRRR